VAGVNVPPVVGKKGRWRWEKEEYLVGENLWVVGLAFLK
jgi:hypothetical protein